MSISPNRVEEIENISKVDTSEDEYHFDYNKVKPKRFTVRNEKQVSKIVILDENIAEIK